LTDGIVLTDISSNLDWACAVAIQKNGRIVVADQASNGINTGFAVGRCWPALCR